MVRAKIDARWAGSMGEGARPLTVPLVLSVVALSFVALSAVGCQGQSPKDPCTTLAEAACERASRCGVTHTAPCPATAEQGCRAIYQRADSGITPQAIEQCAEATRAAACDQEPIPACVLANTPGARAAGAPCSVPSQCASAFCSAPPSAWASVCGQCQPALEPGEDCTASTTPCRGDLTCRSDTGTCGPYRAVGEPCASFSECGLALCISGVCEAVAGDGEPCTLGELCAFGYGCDMGTCKKLTPVSAGQPCNPSLHACIDGLCAGGVCVALPKEGEPCQGSCVVGLACLDGTCKPPAPTDC